jgi:hypothetical protein
MAELEQGSCAVEYMAERLDQGIQFTVTLRSGENQQTYEETLSEDAIDEFAERLVREFEL